MKIFVLPSLALLAVTNVCLAGPYTAAKNNACPDSWQITTTAIPVVYKSTGHSTTSSYPYQSGSASTDKSTVHSHLDSAKAIETIDGTQLTQLNQEDDLLTIASECLKYRNFAADTSDFVTPAALEPNVVTGWIPAAIF